MVGGSSPEFRAILAVVDGTPAARYAFGVACDLAKRHRAALYGIHVIEVPRRLPVDAELSADIERGERVLEAAEATAARAGLKLECNIVQTRNTGSAVVDEAVALGVDAVVMGLDYHRSYGRYDMGSMAQYVLENAPMHVWVIRTPPTSEERS